MKLIRGLIIMGSAFTAMPLLKTGPLWLADAFFVSAGLLLAIIAPKSLVRVPAAIVAASVLAFIAILLTMHVAYDPVGSVGVGMRVLYVWIVIGLLLTSTLPSKKGFAITLMQTYAVGAAVSALVAIGQALFGLEVPGATVQLNRMSGMTGHANAQGGVLGLAFPITVGLLVVGHNRTLNSIMSFLLVIGLILSASVSGMIAALSGTIVLLIMARRIYSGSLIILVVSSITWWAGNMYAQLIPGAKSPWDRFADTTGHGDGVSTLEQRRQTWQVAWQRIQERPVIGFGLDAESGGTVGDTLTHNILLLCWYQGGLLLLLATAMLLISSGKNLWTLSRGKIYQSEAIPLVGACISAVVGAMSGPQLYDRWFWLFILMAITLRIRWRRPRPLPGVGSADMRPSADRSSSNHPDLSSSRATHVENLVSNVEER